MSAPIERAAEAIYNAYENEGAGYASGHTWADLLKEGRWWSTEIADDARIQARRAFESIDVDELAQVADAVFHEWWNDPDEPRFGPLYAQAVRTYLLTGDESDE